MAGREVSVTTNCFAVTRLPTKEYYQYDVAIFPETKIFRKRQEVMQRLQNKIAPNVFSPKALYDGNAILYASHRLKLPGGGSGAYLVDLSDVQRTVPVDENTRGVVKVILTRTSGATIRPSDIKALMSDRRITAKTATALNLLQLIIKQATNEKFPHNPRAFFSESGKKMIPGGLELWRGFFQSVRPTLDQILVNIDTSITAMYQSGPVIDVALAFLGERDVRALALRENDARFHELERFLKGLLIHVEHLGRRTKVIRGLVHKGGSYQFDKDGRTLTVADHFRSAHQLQTRFPDAIGILLSGKNAPRANVVPVEFCKIQPGQLYKKKLPNHLTSEMVSFATIAPGDRLRAIRTSGDGRSLASPIMGYGASEYVVESGMQISSSPLAVKGKILNTPAVHMAMTVQPRDGAWNMRDQRVRQAATLEVWGVINFIPNYPEAQAQRHAQDLHRQMSKIGMNVKPPTAFINGNGQNVRASLNSLMGQIHSICGHSAQLLVVLFPNKGDLIRNEVKRWGDVEHGILTQHMKGDKLQRANDQYFANVAIKINARFGGVNHVVRSPAFTSLSRKPFMIMGADVSHSSPGALRPSIASLVWSQDADATKYVAYTSVQSPRTEMITDLTPMVKKAILKFGAKNPVPENILFYRDGLSEGEIDAVGRREVAAVQQAIDEIWREMGMDAKMQPKPKVTFLIVAKRHHMLFFGDRNSQDVDRTGNLKAGFVTTQGVNSPLFNDFYLQSHAAIKGTARSGHYIVLRDDIFGNNQDMIQECSFALCHTYAKATRSVSIPTPVYYAHVVCTRAAFHFATDLRFDADDGASNHSGEVFDLGAWQRHWKHVNPKINLSMYFL